MKQSIGTLRNLTGCNCKACWGELSQHTATRGQGLCVPVRLHEHVAELELKPLDRRMVDWKESELESTSCPLCGSANGSEFAVRPDKLRVVRCGSCHLLFLSPKPSEEALSRFYRTYFEKHRMVQLQSERYWSELSRSRYQIPASDPRHLLLRRVGVSVKHKRVLDVGCGDGKFLLMCRQLGAKEAVGVEPDANMAQALKSRFELDVHPGYLRDLEGFEGRFDLVTLWDVLEHLSSPMSVISSVRHLLSPSGRIALLTPNADDLAVQDKEKTALRVDFDHICYYGRDAAQHLLGSCGFGIDEVHNWGHPYLEAELLTGVPKNRGRMRTMADILLERVPASARLVAKAESLKPAIGNLGNARGSYHMFILGTKKASALT